MSELSDRSMVIIAFGMVIVMSFAFGGLAWWNDEAEFLNRGGATILMIAALSVVWQVNRERTTEARAHLHDEAARAQKATLTMHTPSVIDRMMNKSRDIATTELITVRRVYIWFVALTTAYGEFLHGWGDLIMKSFGVHESG